MQERNYYILLEVARTATTEEIKIAYRILAKKYHPDKNIGNKASEEYFKEIQQAYAVLSNPEKRKKYDLRFFQGAKTQAQHRTASPGPQYSGNAYQYAQQQAQSKQQTRQSSPQQPSAKQDRSESWQILVSVGIALVLLYFIISYSTGNPNNSSQDAIKKPAEFKSEIPAEPAINNFDSPYTSFFGEELSDSESKNNISIYNSDYSEAVVCLVEKDPPHRVIRNQYMNSGTTFKMNAIPDGEYFLKIYYGSEWEPEKPFVNRDLKGGFKKEKGFVKLNTGDDLLKMKQQKAGTSDSYSSYEIRISPEHTDKVKRISAEEFFQK